MALGMVHKELWAHFSVILSTMPSSVIFILQLVARWLPSSRRLTLTSFPKKEEALATRYLFFRVGK